MGAHALGEEREIMAVTVGTISSYDESDYNGIDEEHPMTRVLREKGLSEAPTRRKIMALVAAGFEVGHVSRYLGVRYQQVYNNSVAARSRSRDSRAPVCINCGRPLEDEESIEHRMGPICRLKVKLEEARKATVAATKAGANNNAT